jgi:hypothetical protein
VPAAFAAIDAEVYALDAVCATERAIVVADGGGFVITTRADQ